MTQTAEPVPSPQRISDLVVAQLTRLDIREAVLIDDALAPGLDAARWLEIVEVLREHDLELYKRVEEVISSEVGTLESVPPQDLLATASRMILGSQSEHVRNLLTVPASPEPALERLEKGLTDLGLAVRKFWRVEPDVPRDAKLYFLDFRLRPEQPETFGQDVSLLLQEIVTRLRDEGQPPAAVLMSRSADDRPNSDDLEMVAREGGGFVRSNFRYLEKALLAEPEHLLFLLYDLLTSLPLGREYFGRVRSLRTATKAVVERVAAETCGLLPTDFNPFLLLLTGGDDRLAAKVADHILGMFSGLLSAELRNDPDVNGSISGLIGVLKNSVMTAPAGLESHTLHRIHQKLLYDRSDWARRAGPSFGDIYRRRGDDTGYYLLMSPECDLELRITDDGTLAPKIEKLLFVRGMVRNERPIKRDSRFVVTPLAEDSAQSHRKWFYWNLRDPAVVPVRQIGSERLMYSKWGRLRWQEAEDIQMRIGSDLLSVGTHDVSGPVRQKTGKVVLIKPNGAEQVLGDVSVMEILPPAKEGESHWALALGSEQILCSADDSRLTASFVTALRCYIPANKFVERLGSHKVYVADEGDIIHLGFYPRNKNLPKKGTWKGPAPQVPTDSGPGTIPQDTSKDESATKQSADAKGESSA